MFAISNNNKVIIIIIIIIKNNNNNNLILKKGKAVKFEGIDLPEGQKMKRVEDDGYKYVWLLEYDDLQHERMKNALRIEYFRQMKKVLKSKLNGRNTILAMNAWAVSVLRYRAGIINWTRAELENMDRKKRKRMAIYGMLHPQAGVDHLYLPRRCGGRGLA